MTQLLKPTPSLPTLNSSKLQSNDFSYLLHLNLQGTYYVIHDLSLTFRKMQASSSHSFLKTKIQPFKLPWDSLFFHLMCLTDLLMFLNIILTFPCLKMPMEWTLMLMIRNAINHINKENKSLGHLLNLYEPCSQSKLQSNLKFL